MPSQDRAHETALLPTLAIPLRPILTYIPPNETDPDVLLIRRLQELWSLYFDELGAAQRQLTLGLIEQGRTGDTTFDFQRLDHRLGGTVKDATNKWLFERRAITALGGISKPLMRTLVRNWIRDITGGIVHARNWNRVTGGQVDSLRGKPGAGSSDGAGAGGAGPPGYTTGGGDRGRPDDRPDRAPPETQQTGTTSGGEKPAPQPPPPPPVPPPSPPPPEKKSTGPTLDNDGMTVNGVDKPYTPPKNEDDGSGSDGDGGSGSDADGGGHAGDGERDSEDGQERPYRRVFMPTATERTLFASEMTRASFFPPGLPGGGPTDGGWTPFQARGAGSSVAVNPTSFRGAADGRMVEELGSRDALPGLKKPGTDGPGQVPIVAHGPRPSFNRPYTRPSSDADDGGNKTERIENPRKWWGANPGTGQRG